MAKNNFRRSSVPRRRPPPALWFEARSLAERPDLSEMRLPMDHYATKKIGVYRCANRLPQGFHRYDRHGHGAQPRQAPSVGRCFHDGRCQQERLFSASATSPAWVASTTPLGSCTTVSWRPCAVGASICRHMGGEGKVVEADETYFGNIPEAQRPQGQDDGPSVLQEDTTGPETQARHRRAWLSAAEGFAHSMSRRALLATVVANRSRQHRARDAPTYR